MSDGGILYSFRRCPYAIRARLALAAAGITVEVREVALKAKPPELLAVAAKGTVPVLVRPDGEILAESLDILLWALGQRPGGAAAAMALRRGEGAALLAECDGPFKHHLDGFRYGRAQRAGWSAPSDGGALAAARDCGSATEGVEASPSAGATALADLTVISRLPESARLEAGARHSTHSDAHRLAALAILRRWSTRLDAMAAADGLAAVEATGVGGPLWGGGESGCLEALGWALLPFVRQFRLTDPLGLAREPGVEGLRRRLAAFEASEAFARIMAPPWAWRQPWRSPRWLYHLALEEEWQEARRQGVYARSTRGKSLAEVGFIHASWSHQLEPTWRRFYADRPNLRLLRIDPERLAAAAITVREEPAPGSGERFPHIYGALPIDAVRLAQRWEAPASQGPAGERSAGERSAGEPSA
ncbi:MAG: DUF952 domain-containing protein [Cyanobacteriota bacterium]|nr:DUF952 domain-containing protein [Cyanobacteriota bacterium]